MPFGRKHGRRATLTSADRGFTRGIEPLEVRQFLSGGFHPFVGGFGHEGMPRTIAPPTEVAASPRRDMGGDLQAASHPSVETFHFARPAPRETSFGSDEGGWRNVDGLYGIRPSDRPEQDEAPVGDRGAGGGKVLRITQISIVFGGSENAPPSGPASSNGGTEVRGPGMGMKPAAVVAEATSHPSFVVVTVPTGAIVVTPYVTGPGDGSGDGIDASAPSGHPSGAERSIKRHLAARTARSRPAEANETRDDDPSDGTFAAAVPAADAAAGSDVGRAGAWRGLFGEVAVLPAARAVAELYRAGASSLMDATSAGVAAGSWARGIIAGVRSLTGAVLDGAAGGAGDAVVAAASDAVEDLVSGLAVQGLGNAAGSGLLYLPSGPVMLLGLAPLSLPGRGWTWWPSQQVWRVTEAVSLVVAVAGYGYCRADGERRGRLQPAAVQGNIAAVKRPADGL